MTQKKGFDFPFRKASAIRMLILDVDGVMTDGSIIMDRNGDELKAFNVRDGHGIKLIQRAGIQVAIITGRTSPVVEARAADLGIGYVIQKCLNKAEGLAQLVKESGIPASQCAMMGDDVLDLPPMYECGLSLAPSDAHISVLGHVDWVSDCPGGRGAIRQAAEGLLLAKDAWQEVVHSRYGVSPEDCGWATS
ncbi:3-deoxy-D-manno-octulosonate 8-phosphate phosphatase (KDO 8-P phosphatase) [Mariprofundus ferrinatatus]|uniref:3-deoxy-D-manno-octulosonate 8-phosphate phosphatase KdsC n=1 Tax=Mariprofundus ferrinatatus TaxID=1921087 RepID=A0A2K8LB14_9PROT|nr:HAD-IIIA family hydrolase [Mariprofundus ferrinatatus]ATX82124.1 3-deoxy-D-manno-octulosonate 8-phosphate phosphatase (KDO 8-P phosphatase) [Mariprofundus ferrinatatus]